jgi:staphylococcal nuclease domain-containing protein 1
MLEPLAKEKLKSTERQAKLDKLRLWVNFVPAPSNSVAVQDDNFTGVVRASRQFRFPRLADPGFGNC